MIKSFLWIVFLAFGLQGAWAYSLGGPFDNNPNPITAAIVQGDAWQTTAIAYGLLGDINGPKNLGEEYRRNVPLMYYACDASFLDFFGSNGVSAVDSAFAILNSALTNNPTGVTSGLDGYSASLSEFPLESRHLNYQAQALGLLDLKSYTLGLMMEQLGLADPVRYNWTLHDRVLLPNTTCPFGEVYLVVQRSFDFTSSPLNQLQYSPYINDTLYSYYIIEVCNAPAPPNAVTVPFSVDPLADTYSPVASAYAAIGYGGFYTGLTRDDVAGLRYLLAANNINYESAPAGSVLVNSSSGGLGGLGPQFLLYTSNYTAFASAALTNNPAALEALYPGLVITGSNSYYVVVATPNIVAYYTNNFVLGNPPVLVVTTNGYTYTPMLNYADTFANLVIITNGYYTNTSAQLVTVQVSQGGVLGNPLVTNTTIKSITLTNVPTASYYINTNYICGPTVILSNQPTGFPVLNVTVTTNLIFATSNTAGYFTSQSIVTYSTNYIFVAQSPICSSGTGVGGVTNGPGLRKGIEKMQFVRANYDSLLGQFFQPITYIFTNVMVTNSQPVNQTFQRVVTTPDFIFSAADIAAGPNTPSPPNPAVETIDRNINFDQTTALRGLAGPGLITPSSTIIFDKVGPVYYNYYGLMNGTPYFTESPNTDGNDLYYAFYFTWASFDGTTNAPVVYPNGESIQNMENEVLVQLSISPPITNSTLPGGTNGQPYTVTTFTATGGAFTPPFTWSATGLPAGLTLTTNTAVLSGTPTQSGKFDFTLTLTDVILRSVQWPFTITIQ